MGIGPIGAVRRALERAKLSVDDLDLVELNEAFAAQAVACVRELGIDPAIVNVNGGAIALGHPLGCSGARITTTLLHELERRGGRYGLATHVHRHGPGHRHHLRAGLGDDVIQQQRTEVSPEIAAIPRSGIREMMDAFWATPGAIPLMTGQPNFPTPPHIVQAATDAALAGKTEYVSNTGIPELREALAAKIRRVNGYDVTPDRIVVSNGGVRGHLRLALGAARAGRRHLAARSRLAQLRA